ncbi:uncharacterized protein EKO05_0010744 [Ascochyta rabiei]|uniref:uncharacterized protein n=1 Tax=Didymella rabiei TaxID=5454 RepID=UPI0021FCAE6C|nr:uncharacterized protein EKO05_0010744 [Ascochyta rabiei]UPX20515.1 hypothetical protein EKO05_0010744 [Ascochyta rabiei]
MYQRNTSMVPRLQRLHSSMNDDKYNNKPTVRGSVAGIEKPIRPLLYAHADMYVSLTVAPLHGVVQIPNAVKCNAMQPISIHTPLIIMSIIIIIIIIIIIVVVVINQIL